MALGGNLNQSRTDGGRGVALGDQPVALADQQVADVQRDGNSMLGVQRWLALARIIAVFDIVVNQRGLVKTFDGDGEFA